MLYYDRIDISKRVDLTKRNKSKKNERFAIIAFLIMDSNFKIMYAMVVII